MNYTVIPERLETNDIISKISSLYYLKRISRLWCREKDTQSLAASRVKETDLRDWEDQMHLEFSGKSTRQERAAETGLQSADSYTESSSNIQLSTDQYTCEELASLENHPKGLGEKNQSIKIDSELKQMLELANKDINTFIMMVFPVF